jgi:hypothetical protein
LYEFNKENKVKKKLPCFLFFFFMIDALVSKMGMLHFGIRACIGFRILK